MISAFLRSHVRVGLAIAIGSTGALAAGAAGYHAGNTDGLITSHLLADYEAKQAVIDSYSEELQAKHAELAQAHEVLTQAVRIYEDGSVRAVQYHWDGTDLVPTYHDFCVDGALCDDDEPTTTAPGA